MLHPRRKPRHQHRTRRAAILPLLAALLPVIIILAALFINVAYMELTRTELRIATDAAARAGGRELTLTGDVVQARLKARDAASRNLVAGEALLLADADIDFGVSERADVVSRYSFVSDPANPNAVRIRGRRTDESPSGDVTLFLPDLLGVTFQPVQEATSTQVELDIVLVVDRSGSMAYAAGETADPYNPPATAPEDWEFGDAVPPNSRWHDAVAAAQVFLNNLTASPQTERVSLVTYAGTATTDATLTDNYSEITDAQNVHTDAFFGGGTGINDGLESGLLSLCDAGCREWATKVIVLLTDGNNTVGPSPLGAAYLAEDSGITVYTITFSSESDQSQMQSIANISGGVHYHANMGAELTDAFQEIASRLPTLLTD